MNELTWLDAEIDRAKKELEGLEYRRKLLHKIAQSNGMSTKEAFRHVVEQGLWMMEGLAAGCTFTKEAGETVSKK